ncbi:MAG TPA: serine/threonine-protein kinase [Pirellulales bacterium]
MHNPLITLDNLSDLAAETLDSLIDRLEGGWRSGCPPQIEDLSADVASLTLSERAMVLRELALVDMEFRLRAGERLSLDDCLSVFPELREDGELTALIEAAGTVDDATTSLCSSGTVTLRRPCAVARARPARLGWFELGELVGSGSFGEVYRARDTRSARDVALKILRREHMETENDCEWFLREARHTARLRHPGIVPVLEAGIIDGVYYLACAYVPGGTLCARLKQGPLSFRRSAETVAQVAEALAYAHHEGVVHRDIKPENILLDVQERPCLVDFGLAEAMTPDASLTFCGALCGTPAYMSPEQFARKHRHIDARSDLYSLGVVLYELLTGQPPFLGRGRMLEAQVLHDKPRSPRRLDEHIPVALENICLKAMSKKPAQRYRTADEMADALHRYLTGEQKAYNCAERRGLPSRTHWPQSPPSLPAPSR